MDPENVGDSAVLSDFGFCTEVTNEASGEEFGSCFYLPPESLESGAFSEKGDIWALGMTLFACLTGLFPFDASTRETAAEAILGGLPNLTELMVAANVPAEAQLLLKKMLARNCEDRLTACQALASPWFDSLRESETVSEAQTPEEKEQWEVTFL
jgi:serine/threonine protein kinase